MKAEQHPQYEQACALAKERGFDAALIKLPSDVRAVVELGCWYDHDEAERVFDLFPQMFHHNKGEFYGKPFELEGWQKRDIVGPLFGWRRPAPCEQGYRRFKEAYIEVPRKNGKTALFSGIGLVLANADSPYEPGAEVYCCAASSDQASMLYNFAAGCVDHCDTLAEGLTRSDFRKSLVWGRELNTFKVLSSKGETKHGSNPHGLLLDELHAWHSRELYDALVTGSGNRRQPLRMAITTAGWDRTSICYEQHTYARGVLDGTLDDPNFLGVIYAADHDDDWTSEDVWKKANPNYNVTIKSDFLKAECEKAKGLPSYQNTFRRLYLNQWTEQDERFIDMHQWSKCAARYDDAILENRPCYGGLDLSSTLDLTAFALVFPPYGDDDKWRARVRSWIPGESMIEKERKDRVPYSAWHADGWVEPMQGSDVLDYDYVRAAINEDCDRFDVREIGYDPYNARQLVNDLYGKDSRPMVEVRQGVQSMSAPTKRLAEMIVSGALAHPSNAALTWAIGNLVVHSDNNGNLKPDKSKAVNRIDPAVALIIAISRAIDNDHNPDTAYAGRDLMVL